MRIALSLFLILLLSSCKQPLDATLTKKSPDGKTLVTIVGKKEMAMDAFHTTLTVKSGDIPEGSLIFDIYANNLTDENVKFDWQDSQHALITFTQSDNEQRSFSLLADDTHVLVEEVKK